MGGFKRASSLNGLPDRRPIRDFCVLKIMHYHRENELEDTIYFSRFDEIYRKGLDCYIHDRVFQQQDLGDYGVCDLIGINVNHKVNGVRHIDVYIYELKRFFIDVSAVHQISRYLFAIKKFLRSKYNAPKYVLNYKLILVGYYVDNDRYFNFLCDAMNIKCYTYDLLETGLIFKKYHPSTFRHKKDIEDNFGDLGDLDVKSICLDIYKEKIHFDKMMNLIHKSIKNNIY